MEQFSLNSFRGYNQPSDFGPGVNSFSPSTRLNSSIRLDSNNVYATKEDPHHVLKAVDSPVYPGLGPYQGNPPAQYSHHSNWSFPSSVKDVSIQQYLPETRPHYVNLDQPEIKQGYQVQQYKHPSTSYELFKQTLDGQNYAPPGEVCSIRIKTEQNAFCAQNQTETAQNYSHQGQTSSLFKSTQSQYYHPKGMETSSPPRYNYFKELSSRRNAEYRDAEYLRTKMDQLSFQSHHQMALRYVGQPVPQNYGMNQMQKHEPQTLNKRLKLTAEQNRGNPAGFPFEEGMAAEKTQVYQQFSGTAPVRPAAAIENKPSETSVRRKWTEQEDSLLREAVAAHGEKNWKSIAMRVTGRNHVQCLQRWKKVLKPGLIKGHWTEEEDELLREVVKKGYRNWGEVAQKIKGRTAKQCRERWSCNLDPKINRDKWTEEEDKKILAAQQQLGNKWSTIAQLLPGRTENAIKTRAKSLIRKEQKKWSPQEDNIILSFKTTKRCPGEEDYEQDSGVGFTRSSAWAKIAARLPGRSKNAVKKRWKELKEKLVDQNQNQSFNFRASSTQIP